MTHERKLEITTRWINSMVDNQFNAGWFGDKSAEHRKSQIDYLMRIINNTEKIGAFRMVAVLCSDASNLKQYCGWTEEEINELLSIFGIKDLKQAYQLYNIENAVLKEIFVDNKFYPDKLKHKNPL